MTAMWDHYWQRRIAAMRIIHLWFLGGAIATVLSLVVCLVYAFFAWQPYAGNLFIQATVFALRSVLLIVAAVLVFAIGRHWIFVRNYRNIGTPVNLARFPHLARLIIKFAEVLRRPCDAVEIRVIIDPKAAPAQVFAGSDTKLYIVVRLDFLQIAKYNPILLEGILWHELGHYIQWDTKFGYWSLRLIEWLGVVTLSLVGVLLLDTGYDILFHTTRHVGATTLRSFANVMQLTGIVCIVFAFWFVRHCRRFSEHNADLTAGLAGYGAPLSACLSTMKALRPSIMTFIGLHPTPAARVKMIQKFCAQASIPQAEQGSSAEGGSPTGPPAALVICDLITRQDYLYAFCVHVAAKWLLVCIAVATISGGLLMRSFLALLEDPHSERTIAEYFETVGLMPKRASVHQLLGVQLGNRGDWDAAISEEREAIRLDPKLAEAHDDLGWALGHKGQWDAAIMEEREAIRINPKLAEAHYDLGRSLGHKDQWETVIVEEREAISLDPNIVQAHRYLGWALGRREEWDAAIDQEREAIRLDPRQTEAREDLGWMIGHKGDWNAAIVEEREAVRINPGSARAHWMLGFSFGKSNDNESARAEYLKACQLDGNSYSCPQ